MHCRRRPVDRIGDALAVLKLALCEIPQAAELGGLGGRDLRGDHDAARGLPLPVAGLPGAMRRQMVRAAIMIAL
jgi:hypothetical protein